MIFNPIKDKTEYSLSGFPELSGVYGFISDNSISFIKNNALNYGQASILNINGANTILKNNDYAVKRIGILDKDSLILNINIQAVYDEEQEELPILPEEAAFLDEMDIPEVLGITIPVDFGQISTQILLNKKYNSITSYDVYTYYDQLSGYISGFEAPERI